MEKAHFQLAAYRNNNDFDLSFLESAPHQGSLMPQLGPQYQDNSDVIKLDLMPTSQQNNAAIMDFSHVDDNSPSRREEPSDNRSIYRQQGPEAIEPEPIDDDVYYEEVEDDFPETTFDVAWQQKCWDILYHLWFDEEAAIFLKEISEEEMGADCYEAYIESIEHPVNFSMIKAKLK